MYKVVFIFFSKPTRKYFSVYASLFDKVTQVTFTLAFFISYSRLQLYNKRTLTRVPVNFETILRFLTEHPKVNTFVPFRSLWDFTTTLKIVFHLLHWDSCPWAALRKQHTGKEGPGTLGWHSGPRSLRCDTKVRHYGGTLRWDPQVGP